MRHHGLKIPIQTQIASRCDKRRDHIRKFPTSSFFFTNTARIYICSAFPATAGVTANCPGLLMNTAACNHAPSACRHSRRKPSAPLFLNEASSWKFVQRPQIDNGKELLFFWARRRRGGSRCSASKNGDHDVHPVSLLEGAHFSAIVKATINREVTVSSPAFC